MSAMHETLQGLDGATRLYPILGDPIAHVKSPRRLTLGFIARGANAACVPMEVPAAAFDPVMRALAATPNVDGLLVTMPHKGAAAAHCTTLSAVAQTLGCISVMRRNPNGSWHGDMLDGRAFVRAQREVGAVHAGSRALLVGAGSAGSAIAIALLEAGVRELAVYDADADRTRQLLALLAAAGHRAVQAGSPVPTRFDIVCNATPLGMGSHDPLPLPTPLLEPAMFVGDVVAGRSVTPLVQAARDRGCRTSDGLAMVEAVQEDMLAFFLDKPA